MSTEVRDCLRKVSTLMDFYELTGQLILSQKYRSIGPETAECKVLLFSHLAPIELAKWLRAVSSPSAPLDYVIMERHDAGRGNSIYLRAAVTKGDVRYVISWSTGVESWRDDRPDWYLGKPLMKVVGFLRVNKSRSLSAEEIQKFLAWADELARESVHG